MKFDIKLVYLLRNIFVDTAFLLCGADLQNIVKKICHYNSRISSINISFSRHRFQ